MIYAIATVKKDKNMDLAETILGKQPEKTPANLYPHLLSYEEINQYTTEQIIVKLKILSISFSEKAFLQDIQQMISAEEISEKWFEKYDLQLSGRMEDFLWFAATV